MARPQTTHPGFLIPNAGGVTSPQMAEPDQVDFNTLGNARYGVIEGCLVTIAGTTATNTAGTALVNGQLVTMAGGQTVSLGSAGTQDRYDLLTVDTNGKLQLVPGTPAADPLYPDPPTDRTVLAAAYCATGATTYVDTIIDKRKFLPDSLLTKVSPAADLVVNRNGTGNLYRIDGSGITSWSGDTTLQRSGPKTLQVTENLTLDGNLGAGGGLSAQSLTVTGLVQGSNLRRGAAPTGTGNPGDFYQASDGRVYVYRSSGWTELATLPSISPVGMVIQSLLAPEEMPSGWVPLKGDTVTEDAYPTLFTIPALAGFIHPGTPRTMTLPDARNRVLLGDFTAAGQPGGKSTITIALANLPRHRHNVSVDQGGGSAVLRGTIGRAGTHSHTASGGRHGHDVEETPHKHYWAEAPAGGAFVALSWNGENKIDAYFNDRSHTYSVESADWTGPAVTNVRVLASASSDHPHAISPEGDHDHPLTLDGLSPHLHNVTEQDVGANVPIDYQPLFLTMFVYVRV